MCCLFCSPFVPPGLSARKCGTARSTSCPASQLQPCPPDSTIRCLAGCTSCCLAYPCPPATLLQRVLFAQLPVSTPPTGLDEYVFFKSLVVRLPYSSIFCQFWWFFAFKLLLSFLRLCKEAQCVYLRLHLGWKSQAKHFDSVS